MKLKKQKSLLFIPLIFSGILTSCVPNNNQVLIPQVINDTISKENYTIAMTKERYLAFKEGKRSFVLLYSSELCHVCLELEPLLINYVKEKNVEIYKLEVTAEDYSSNKSFYDEEMGLRGTPTILIFANGEIVHRELGTGKLKTRKEVITFFNQHIKTLDYYAVNSDAELNEPKSSIFFKYNFDIEISQALVNDNFYPLFSKKTTVYLIDENTRTNLEISFSDYSEVFTFSSENSDLRTALDFFSTNFS